MITVVNEEKPVKKSKRQIVRTILMWVFFPIGLFSLFWTKITPYFKLNITAKTSILYSILFLLSLGTYVAFVVVAVLQDDGSGSLASNVIAGTIIIGIVSLVIFITFGSIASQTMLNPIKKIIKQVDTITANDLSQRIDMVASQDELNELTTQINEMLDNLEESFNRQTNFVSDASHELRTPIAVIQGYSDLLDRWGKTDPAILDEAIGAIKTESTNMQTIVNRLLYLAKLGSFKPNYTQFYLDEIVKDLIAAYEMTEKTKQIYAVVENEVMIDSDKALIIELIRIITDNAIKYTPRDGMIRLTLQRERKIAKVIIEDSGVGISEEDLPHIFDRFYRCDKARGREQGSTGLGLAIAKSIAEMLGVSIEVQSTLGKGTAFTIIIPIQGNASYEKQSKLLITKQLK